MIGNTEKEIKIKTREREKDVDYISIVSLPKLRIQQQDIRVNKKYQKVLLSAKNRGKGDSACRYLSRVSGSERLRREREKESLCSDTKRGFEIFDFMVAI